MIYDTTGYEKLYFYLGGKCTILYVASDYAWVRVHHVFS
jgi:hypothetical protein